MGAYNPGGGPPPSDRSTRPTKKPRKLHTYQTKPILHNLQYHLQGWKYDTANRKRIISMMHLQGCIKTLRVLAVYRAHQLTKHTNEHPSFTTIACSHNILIQV